VAAVAAAEVEMARLAVEARKEVMTAAARAVVAMAVVAMEVAALARVMEATMHLCACRSRNYNAHRRNPSCLQSLRAGSRLPHTNLRRRGRRQIRSPRSPPRSCCTATRIQRRRGCGGGGCCVHLRRLPGGARKRSGKAVREMAAAVAATRAATAAGRTVAVRMASATKLEAARTAMMEAARAAMAEAVKAVTARAAAARGARGGQARGTCSRLRPRRCNCCRRTAISRDRTMRRCCALPRWPTPHCPPRSMRRGCDPPEKRARGHPPCRQPTTHHSAQCRRRGCRPAAR